MYDKESQDIVNEIILSVGKRCASQLHYTRVSSEEINSKIDSFHEQVGTAPTFEQIKIFNDENGGINCGLFAEAACDLLRADGITADRVNLLDPRSSTGSADNHAVVYAAGRLWLEPQSGKVFSCNDWDTFAEFYAKPLGIDQANLVAYSPRDRSMWASSNWSIPEN